MPRPASTHPSPRPQVVYVVLEAQYQASLSAAVNKINTHRKEVRWGGGAGERGSERGRGSRARGSRG